MKIRADRKTLADALAWVAQAVPRNPQAPELAGIRLTAADGGLRATAFDYDQQHTATLDVDVVTDGECLISGRFLSWIVGSLKAPTVDLVLDADELTISGGRSTYRARVMRLDDYPRLPEQPAEVGRIDADDLADTVAAGRQFIDSATPMGILCGIHLEGDADELTAVGLRSSGISIARAPWRCARPFEATPFPAAVDAAVKGMSGDVAIGYEGGVLGLSDARRSVTMRTIEGEYPHWRRPLRAADDDLIQVVTDSGDLLDAVRRAGALDADTALAVTFGAAEIEVAIATDERGGGIDVVPAERTGDSDAVLGMNSRYLLAGLAAMPPGPVRLGIGHREKGLRQAVTIRPLDSHDRMALVMPKDLPGGTR